MKKLFTLALTLFFTSLAMAAGKANDTITVTTAEQFIEVIKNDNHANIRLADDIQLGALRDRICDTFSGSINGLYEAVDPKTKVHEMRSHVIYGDRDTQVTWLNHELFGKVDGAEFMNLVFCNIFIDTYNHSNTGLIAREAKNTSFFEVTFDHVKVSCNNDNAGIITGRAIRCNFGVITSKYIDVYTAGVNCGGLVGYSEHCQFDICITNPGARVYADGRWGDDACAGGFSGLSVRDQFRSCINSASVGANDNKVGGYAGKSIYSDFLSCDNSGFVGHQRHDLFVEYSNKIIGKIAALTDSQTFATVTGLIGMGATIGGFALSPLYIADVATKICEQSIATRGLSWFYKLSFSLKSSLLDAEPIIEALPNGDLWYASYCDKFMVYKGNVTAANMASYCNVVMKPLAVVLAIEIAATITWTILQGDDETGGISAHARGGLFELCSNLGELNCKDDNCGGIVGLGQGVTINNCFNSGKADYDEDDTTGSILGKAEVDESNGNKKCLVTNCLSTWGFHIVGDYYIEDGLDPASGNNYRLEGGKGDDVSCEMKVNNKQIESGIVARWLNQGIQNRLNGKTPWRQNIVAEVDSLRDKRPYPDYAHAEVTIDVLPHDTITTADQLMAFAKKVNSGDQFACAVLDADIDLIGQDWTPIGKDGFTTNFRGIFDGRGHTIYGLKCSSDRSVGLFGTVHACAEITNVNIGADCEIVSTSDLGAGGIVGTVSIGWKWGNIIIENCSNYGNVSGKEHVGGILGRVKGNMGEGVRIFVNNCCNLGTITAEKGNSALLCGYMKQHGVVRNSWSGGQLRTLQDFSVPYSSYNPKNQAEYLAGYDKKLDIKNCYIINPATSIDSYGKYPLQEGVSQVSTEDLASGALTYDLNGGVVDGTQPWYQKLGPDGDAYPVRTKLPDGTNMVFSYPNIEGNIGGFANTSSEEITDVITGKTPYAEHKVVDIDQTRKVDVSDLVSFIAAANR